MGSRLRVPQIQADDLGPIIGGRTGWDYHTCPVCGDSKGHFAVSQDHGGYRCYKCDTSGVLKDASRRPSLKREDPGGYISTPEYLQGLSLYPECVGDRCYRLARRYLTQRGIGGVEIPLSSFPWGVMGSRLVFPIYQNGVMMSYQARSLVRGDPNKVVSGDPARGWEKTSDLVYGIDKIWGKAVICEGIASSLVVQNGVAVFGSLLSQTQALKILSKALDITVFFDSDAEDKAILTVEKLMSLGIRPRIVLWGDEFREKTDPADVDAKTRKRLLDNAVIVNTKLDLVRCIIRKGA